MARSGWANRCRGDSLATRRTVGEVRVDEVGWVSEAARRLGCWRDRAMQKPTTSWTRCVD
eukprot:scaffold97766_cov60-Phaeocystis_antarctica.AAC.2